MSKTILGSPPPTFNHNWVTDGPPLLAPGKCKEPTNEKTACYANCFAQTINGNDTAKVGATLTINAEREKLCARRLKALRSSLRGLRLRACGGSRSTRGCVGQ